MIQNSRIAMWIGTIEDVGKTGLFSMSFLRWREDILPCYILSCNLEIDVKKKVIYKKFCEVSNKYFYFTVLL